MSLPTFSEFQDAMLAQGYDQVLVRHWEANQNVAMHHHPFEANALVVQGEFWLTLGENTHHLKSGDRFQVPKGMEHAERYGPQGAEFWVARKS